MTARLVFMGTPRSAIPTFEAVSEAHQVGLVVTQPDRPRGRSSEPKPPPLKEAALDRGAPVAQPETHEELLDALEGHGPFDLGVVVAYGRILRQEILDLPSHGLLNLHFSLLPRWRGAAPVARALMAGDLMTGVTIFRLDEGMDTGPVLTAQALDVLPDENAGQLTERLALVGARLMDASIEPYLSGAVSPMPQSDEGATHAEKLTARDRPLDVDVDPRRFVDHVRGLAPVPGATLNIDGARHQILGAEVRDDQVEPGTWTLLEGSPMVGVGGGSVLITRIKPPGRNVQSGDDWARGRRVRQGTVD